MPLEVGEDVVRVSNSLDPGETLLGVSPGFKLFSYDNIHAVVSGGLRVKVCYA